MINPLSFQNKFWLAARVCGMSCVFSLRAKIWGQRLDDSLPACAICFCFKVDQHQLTHTPTPLFTPESVHSGSASWDNCGQVFPDTLKQQPRKQQHLYFMSGQKKHHHDEGHGYVCMCSNHYHTKFNLNLIEELTLTWKFNRGHKTGKKRAQEMPPSHKLWKLSLIHRFCKETPLTISVKSGDTVISSNYTPSDEWHSWAHDRYI